MRAHSEPNAAARAIPVMDREANAPTSRAPGTAKLSSSLGPVEAAPRHDEADDQEHSEYPANSRHLPHRIKRRAYTSRQEPTNFLGAAEVIVDVAHALRGFSSSKAWYPHRVDDRQRDRMQGGGPPAPPGQRRQPDDRDHHQRNAPRAQKPGESSQQPQPVSAIHRAVMVGEQELGEAEDQRPEKPDLNRIDDVLGPGAEEDQQQGHRGSDPGADTGATHDHTAAALPPSDEELRERLGTASSYANRTTGTEPGR